MNIFIRSALSKKVYQRKISCAAYRPFLWPIRAWVDLSISTDQVSSAHWLCWMSSSCYIAHAEAAHPLEFSWQLIMHANETLSKLCSMTKDGAILQTFRTSRCSKYVTYSTCLSWCYFKVLPTWAPRTMCIVRFPVRIAFTLPDQYIILSCGSQTSGINTYWSDIISSTSGWQKKILFELQTLWVTEES